MEKLSTHKLAEMSQVVAATGAALRQVTDERDALRDKIAQMKLRDDAEKLAQTMHQKGIYADVPIDSLVEHLEKQAQEGTLDVTRRAVDMVGADMGTKMAQLDNSEDRNPIGGSDFVRYLVGSVG